MRHEMLSQRAPFCIGAMAKKGTLSQHFVTHVVPPLVCAQGRIDSFGEEGMQLVQPSKCEHARRDSKNSNCILNSRHGNVLSHGNAHAQAKVGGARKL